MYKLCIIILHTDTMSFSSMPTIVSIVHAQFRNKRIRISDSLEKVVCDGNKSLQVKVNII